MTNQADTPVNLSDRVSNNLWNWAVPQIVSIILTVLIIGTLSYIYYRKVSKMKPDEAPRGFVLVCELVIKAVEKLVIDVMGSKYRYLTVYFLYLISYILIGNWIALIGFEPVAGTLTTTFYLAIITFIGIYYLSIKFQRLVFLKKFIFEILTQLTSLVSLSVRLFGNILSGTIVLTILWKFTFEWWEKIPYIASVNLLYSLIAGFLKIYFEIFDTAIQAVIFSVLTIVYWNLAMAEGQHKPQAKQKIDNKTIIVKDKELEQTYSERYLVDPI